MPRVLSTGGAIAGGYGRGLDNAADAAGQAMNQQQQREIPREIERLAHAACTLQDLQGELSNRLGRYCITEMPGELAKVAQVEHATTTDAGRELRELAQNLEVTASQLRQLLRTLAI